MAKQQKNFKNVDWLNGRATLFPMSWLDKPLTKNEFRVGLAMLSVVSAKTKDRDRAGHGRISQDTLATQLNMHRTKVSAAYRGLIAKGCVEEVSPEMSGLRYTKVFRVIDIADQTDTKTAITFDQTDTKTAITFDQTDTKTAIGLTGSDTKTAQSDTKTAQSDTKTAQTDTKTATPSESTLSHILSTNSKSLEESNLKDLSTGSSEAATSDAEELIENRSPSEAASEAVVYKLMQDLESHRYDRDMLLMSIEKLGFADRSAIEATATGRSLVCRVALPDQVVAALSHQGVEVSS